MPSPRPFRFGVIHEQPQDPATWASHIRRIEDLGFYYVVSDRQLDRTAPLVARLTAR